MNEPTNWAAELIGEFEERNAPAAQLARILSIGCRIEPELLRTARLRLLPQADVGIEADLWFSPLVQSQSPPALVLIPEVVEALRGQLTAEPDLLNQAWELLRDVHRDAPVTMRLEEEITWLALVGTDEAIRRIDDLLRPVVAAMVGQDRRGLSQWVLRAFPRLPDVVRNSETVWMLAMGAGARLGGRHILKSEMPRHALREWLPWVLPRDISAVALGVRLVGDVCHFREPPQPHDHTIEVPQTDPRLVEVSRQEGGKHFADLVRIDAGGSQSLEVGGADLQLRTASGACYTLRRRPVGAAAEWRTVRVYVCSTFRDMQPEREYLTRVVFPELRARCEQLRIRLVDIDPRWGVAQERAEDGDMLASRFQQIDDCRPYFIGLIGSRYGWIPDGYSEALVRRHPWVKSYPGCSSLHLEILHALGGVSETPDSASGISFYLRESRLGERGGDRTRSEAEEEFMLAKLLAELHKNERPFVYDGDLEKLGRQVLENLWNAIRTDHPAPERSQIGGRRETATHEVYARERMRVVIARSDYTAALERHLDSGEGPLIVKGPAGSGKSTLLAGWAVHIQRTRPDAVVFMHFAAAETEGPDSSPLLRRLVASLQAVIAPDAPLPEAPGELRGELDRLSAIASRARHARNFIVVIDGLDEIVDKHVATWWPTNSPHFRLFASSRAGSIVDEWVRRGGAILELQALTTAELADFLRHYLSRHSLRLDDSQIGTILRSPWASSPALLAAFVDELRDVDSSRLRELQIEEAGRSFSPETLFGRSLQRCEAEQGRRMTEVFLTRIWASRRGLSESVLRSMLSGDAEPLPSRTWSSLYYRLERFLRHDEGLLSFVHRSVQVAVENRYLTETGSRSVAHQHLANYLSSLPLSQLSERDASELLWQLSQAENWVGLRQVLADPERFARLWEIVPAEVKSAWDRFGAAAPEQLKLVFATASSAVTRNALYTVRVADLLEQIGNFEDALVLWNGLSERFAGTKELGQAQTALWRRASILKNLGRPGEALEALDEHANACEQSADRVGKIENLLFQGEILRTEARLKEALRTSRKCAEQCLELGDRTLLAKALFQSAELLAGLQRLDEAKQVLHEALEAAEAAGCSDLIARILSLRDETEKLRKERRVQASFTLFVPHVVQPDKWFGVLAFVTVDSDQEQAMLDRVRRHARSILGDRFDEYREEHAPERFALPEEAKLTFVPEAEGVQFNPPRQSLQILEDCNRVEVRFRVAKEYDGRTAMGKLSIEFGSTPLTRLTLALHVTSAAADGPSLETPARPQRRVFASYSQQDRDMVAGFIEAARASGDVYLNEAGDAGLRPGEDFVARTAQMIEQADVVRLFWSNNARNSTWVEKELYYAESAGKPIEAVYWEDPQPQPSPVVEYLGLHFMRMQMDSPRQTEPRKRRSFYVGMVSESFVSHRQAVVDFLIRSGVTVVSWEWLDASSVPIEQMIEKKMRSCDALICLVGSARGPVSMDDPDYRSYAQIEYETAQELQKPIYVFMPGFEHLLDKPIVELSRDSNLQERFVERVRKNPFVHVYGSIENLQHAVAKLTITR